MNNPQIAPTPTAVREALDAKSALRNGIDPRPGVRCTLKISSRSSGHCVAGRIVPFGVSIIDNVHQDDVHEFVRWVDTSTPEELAAVNLELRRRISERDAARREGAGVPRVSIEPLAVHRAVLRRDMLPFVSVEVLSDEPEAPAPAAKAARK